MHAVKVHALDGGHLLPPLPEALLLVLSPVAPLCSRRVWRHAQRWLRGALLAPGARPVTAAWRALGRATARHCTHAHRVLNRVPWSTRPGSRMRWGGLVTCLVPPGATLVLGADDPVARRRGCQITAQGGDRDAGRSTKKPGIRGVGLQGVAMRRLGPGPWSQRVWARPLVTARGGPAQPRRPRRHQTRVEWVRPMSPPGRRWLPGPPWGLGVEGGLAAVSLALACGNPPVTRGARVRWEAARDHPPAPPPAGTRGPQPTQGKRHRSLQGWAERAEPPWEAVDVEWSGG
jgi:hypothetical protein